MERRATGSCAPGAGCARRGRGRFRGPRTMTHPTSHIDTIVLAIGALLALLILLIGYHLLPEVADLMPSGAH